MVLRADNPRMDENHITLSGITLKIMVGYGGLRGAG